jgi:hypothetical protein
MLFCGIDLHSDNCFVVVSDDADKVLYSRRLHNNLAEICSALTPYQADLFGVVVESTYNWYWLADGLIDAGYSLHLANTTAIKQYDGLKHRRDESDARHLAHILRLGLLPEGHIMPRATRAVRDLACKRMQLVQQRTAQIVSIETCMAQQTGGRLSSNDVKQLTDAHVDAMSLGVSESMGLKANLAVMQALQVQIDVIETALSKHCRRNPNIASSKPCLASDRSWQRLFSLKPAASSDLPTSTITHRTAAALAAFIIFNYPCMECLRTLCRELFVTISEQLERAGAAIYVATYFHILPNECSHQGNKLVASQSSRLFA